MQTFDEMHTLPSLTNYRVYSGCMSVENGTIHEFLVKITDSTVTIGAQMVNSERGCCLDRRFGKHTIKFSNLISKEYTPHEHKNGIFFTWPIGKQILVLHVTSSDLFCRIQSNGGDNVFFLTSEYLYDDTGDDWQCSAQV